MKVGVVSKVVKIKVQFTFFIAPYDYSTIAANRLWSDVINNLVYSAQA